MFWQNFFTRMELMGSLPRYTFQHTCDEDPELKLQDGSLRIFLNTTATELSDLDQKPHLLGRFKKRYVAIL